MKGAVKYIEVPSRTSSSKCKSGDCQVEIHWVPNGKTRPDGKGGTKPCYTPVDCAGDSTCSAPTEERAGKGISHYYTCTDPNRFTRKGK